jgi:hypothetical protein
MDGNLARLGINQKKEKRIKDAMAQINMHSLLNIRKAYHANTHQGKARPSGTEGPDRLKKGRRSEKNKQHAAVKVRLGRAAARIDIAERLFVGFGFSKLLS